QAQEWQKSMNDNNYSSPEGQKCFLYGITFGVKWTPELLRPQIKKSQKTQKPCDVKPRPQQKIMMEFVLGVQQSPKTRMVGHRCLGQGHEATGSGTRAMQMQQHYSDHIVESHWAKPEA